jgi:ATP-dependent DNA ligase
MEARRAAELPFGEQWAYEPKWDGFRCLAFRDGGRVELQSKGEKPLTRYFPEIVEALRRVKAERFVVDGELIVPREGRLSFDDLLQRIHPAESRVTKLARETPAQFVLFDLLVDDGGASLVDEPLRERRRRLEGFARRFLRGNQSLALSRFTPHPEEAKGWLEELRGQLDGVIAKPLDEPYRPGERAMIKVKALRTADCVVGGFRYASAGKVAGSLLLGLYDGDLLHHVGFTSSMAAAERKALTRKLEALVEPPGFTGRAPGGPSRWSTERSAQWEPLKPELVVEVEFDHFTGERFRHGTKFLRWRPDKAPRQCTIEQVRTEAAAPIAALLAS